MPMSQYRGGRTSLVALTVVVTLMWSATAAHAITIVVDYTHDTFISTHSGAQAALEAAAADLSNYIQTPLNATSSSDQGEHNQASVSANWDFGYVNPATGSSTTTSGPMAADEVRVFAGVRNLTGNTLGQGGPGGAWPSGGAVPYSYSPAAVGDLGIAVDNFNASASDNMLRDGGPHIGTLTAAITAEGQTFQMAVDYGVSVGHIWFDSDTNNSGSTDTQGQLEAFWHFDHTTDVAVGKFDFYTVALHELLHVLGIGSSLSWDNLVDGTTWLGSSVADLLGSGAGAVSSDGSHIASSLQSYDLVNGDLQYTVMGPTLAAGERRYLTELDAAFLADIGWSVIPEPGTVSILLFGTATLLLRRRRMQAGV
ncbi:PEP-CTERM sorting domain-containing protein [Phycisphaerales bacterium AB-hyl4]|uniref:PEP-CTERM sorting domain-containing protein n=1 Tax=Natronomicrosphaera hydrolytica TaxID=3242702 RepID=A0ABV4U1Q6_9BACT